MVFDYSAHIFHSPKFKSVLDEAFEFFIRTPVHRLPILGDFPGAGVYALYYAGRYDLYINLSKLNQLHATHPIYVGKAVPPGWRAARQAGSKAPVLYRRLKEHTTSIIHAENLDLNDFMCRFMILNGIESDLIVPLEAELIRRYRPIWNSVIDGFGNHDPGKGRYNQAKSEWDVLHPGRPWVNRLTGPTPNLDTIIAKIRSALSLP